MYPEKKIVHHQWKKYIFGDHFKEVFLKGAEVFEKYGCTKWLSDDRENSSLPEKDRLWAIEVWEPLVRKSGWKHWALVLPQNIFGEFNMKMIAEYYTNSGINVEFFTDPDEATAWLEDQQVNYLQAN